jgi:hypothetical protein
VKGLRLRAGANVELTEELPLRQHQDTERHFLPYGYRKRLPTFLVAQTSMAKGVVSARVHGDLEPSPKNADNDAMKALQRGFA